MIPFDAWNRIAKAFQHLAVGGSESALSRGQLFEELSRMATVLELVETLSVSANYTIVDSDRTVRVDATGGARTIGLPAASTVKGVVFRVKKVDASANAVTVDPFGAELIDGLGTYALTAQWDSVTFQSNGVGWDVLQSGTVTVNSFTLSSTIDVVVGAFIADAAELLDTIVSELQVYAADGVTPVSSDRIDVLVRVSDSASDYEPSPTAILKAGGLGSLLAGTDTATALFRTDSNGKFKVGVYETIGIPAQNTYRYLWIVAGGNTRKAVIARDGVHEIIFH